MKCVIAKTRFDPETFNIAPSWKEHILPLHGPSALRGEWGVWAEGQKGYRSKQQYQCGLQAAQARQERSEISASTLPPYSFSVIDNFVWELLSLNVC